jgi:sulfotransferase
MRIATLAGLPRSGSTLLCNLLAQRDDVTVSSTSGLPGALAKMSEFLTNSPEVTSDLIGLPEARERNVSVLRGIVNNWHPDDGRLVVDKSRGWGWSYLLLQRLYPDARMVAAVRHPRDVFASIEKQHRATAEYGPHEPLWDKANVMFSQGGMIGGPIAAVEDMIRRRPFTQSGIPFVFFAVYEGFTAAPDVAMRGIDKHLGLEPFDYDFDKVVSVATDADALYRFKFPHDGSGQVEQRPVDADLVPDDLAAQIKGRWPLFHQTFGY